MAEKPTRIQPLSPLSAPSLNSVWLPAVTLISSANKPEIAFGSWPCATPSVR